MAIPQKLTRLISFVKEQVQHADCRDIGFRPSRARVAVEAPQSGRRLSRARAPRRLHRWALSVPTGLAGAVRPLLRRSRRRPRALLWDHGRLASAQRQAGAGSFAARRACPIHPGRRDGLRRHGVAAWLRRPVRRSSTGGRRVQHSASPRLAPRHGHLRPGSPARTGRLQFLGRSRKGDASRHRRSFAADPRLASGDRTYGAARFRGRVRPPDAGPEVDLTRNPAKHHRARAPSAPDSLS
jgi:hypothetical protein